MSQSKNNELPRFTISIPYFMGWHNLMNTLRLVLKQDYPQDCYEIVVLNDGGIKHIGSWPPDIPKERICWIDNKERLGMVGNWNKAMQVGKHPWVWFLHADDLPYHDFLSNVAKAIIQEPDAGMVYTKAAFWSNDPKSLLYWRGRIQYIIRGKVRPIRYERGANAVRHVMSGVVCPTVVLNKEKFLVLGGFNTDFPYSADEEFWPRLAHKFPVIYIPRRLVRYLFHPDQTSEHTKYLYDFWEQYQKVNYKIIDYLENDLSEQDIIRIRKKLCRVAINLASKFAINGQASNANLYLKRAIKEYDSCHKWWLFRAVLLMIKHPHLGRIFLEIVKIISALFHKLLRKY